MITFIYAVYIISIWKKVVTADNKQFLVQSGTPTDLSKPFALHSFLWIWVGSHLLKKSLMESLIFCAVFGCLLDNIQILKSHAYGIGKNSLNELLFLLKNRKQSVWLNNTTHIKIFQLIFRKFHSLTCYYTTYFYAVYFCAYQIVL